MVKQRFKIKRLGNGTILVVLSMATRVIMYHIQPSQICRCRITEKYSKNTTFNIWNPVNWIKEV